MNLLDRLGVSIPIVQAPMAGVSTPALAAAVSEAGALGSIGVGAATVADAAAMIAQVRERTGRAFNVNVFAHRTPRPDPAREGAWVQALTPLFDRFQAAPPTALRTIYSSFLDDPAIGALLAAERVPLVSFHFGLPTEDQVRALRTVGCVLVSNATSLAEASPPARRGWTRWSPRGGRRGRIAACSIPPLPTTG